MTTQKFHCADVEIQVAPDGTITIIIKPNTPISPLATDTRSPSTQGTDRP